MGNQAAPGPDNEEGDDPELSPVVVTAQKIGGDSLATRATMGVLNWLGQRPSLLMAIAAMNDAMNLGVGGVGTAVSGDANAINEVTQTVTVGRVMSAEEYEAMVATNTVQESFNGGVTSVTIPPNPSGYRAGPSSDIYVQFDVPQSAINASANGWGKIYGPTSIFGPALGITEMPPATNITVP
jgi:hypothetical protein